jgi:hypothetical protein
VLSADRLGEMAERGVDVRVHPRFTDDELQTYFKEIDALVLPYRFGTHSGWVEACYDAGVAAVVPDCGFFAEQHDDPTFHYGQDGPDGESLRGAVFAGLALAGRRRAAGRDRRAERQRQLHDVRRATTGLYRRLLAGVDAA